MELKDWIEWLQVRIPELKERHNSMWLELALEGYRNGEGKRRIGLFGDLLDQELYAPLYSGGRGYLITRGGRNGFNGRSLIDSAREFSWELEYINPVAYEEKVNLPHTINAVKLGRKPSKRNRHNDQQLAFNNRKRKRRRK